MTDQLMCPKCHGSMRRYERNDVTVDQCSECRGIFLDRGELEQLIDAEQRWHGEGGREGPPAAQAAPSAPPSPSAPTPPQPHPGGEWFSGGRRKEWHSGPRGFEGRGRKRSFLDDLFG